MHVILHGKFHLKKVRTLRVPGKTIEIITFTGFYVATFKKLKSLRFSCSLILMKNSYSSRIAILQKSLVQSDNFDGFTITSPTLYFCECVGTMRWVRYKCSFGVESTFSMKLSEYTKLGSLKIFGFPFFDTF